MYFQTREVTVRRGDVVDGEHGCMPFSRARARMYALRTPAREHAGRLAKMTQMPVTAAGNLCAGLHWETF
jgi:hypothetical protein